MTEQLEDGQKMWASVPNPAHRFIRILASGNAQGSGYWPYLVLSASPHRSSGWCWKAAVAGGMKQDFLILRVGSWSKRLETRAACGGHRGPG